MNDDNNNTESIFAKTLTTHIETFSEFLDKHNVPISIVIILDPNTRKPVIHTTGHDYDVGVMLATTLKMLKKQLCNKLET